MSMKVKVSNWFGMKDQVYKSDGRVWGIARLVEQAKDLEPFKIPMKGLNIYNLYPIPTSMLDFVAHIKSVLDADLSKPIILDQDGYVMDGRHRIARALLEEKEFILAVRFDETPEHDYEEPEDE